MLTTIREEQLLAKFAGEDVAVPQPCTRTEKFLAKMAGLDVQTPTPITREEQILNKIAEGGGGGGDLEYSTREVVINCPAIADEYMTASNITKDIDSDTLISGAPIANNKIYNYLTIPVTDGLTNFSQKFAIFGTFGPEDPQPEIQMNEQMGYTASASGDVTFVSDPDAGWIFIVTGSGTITITADEPL